ncbi:MAG: peptidase domain-containing ABC transporter [Bacteroidales bacterium]|nr:peptidase domain-containing ABC transporter [Bacteroidales bacterium]
MNKRIKVKQHDITDCGAACLSSISSYYGLDLPLSKIRQIAHTDRRGTNILGLTEAAHKLGFDTKAVKSVHDDGTVNLIPLQQIPTPAIAHVIVNNKLLHYVVIYRVSKSFITIMDPATGELHKKKLDDFAKEWTGILVLMLPTEDFRKGDSTVSMLSRFMFLLKPHKGIITQAIIGALIYTLLGLGTSIYVQKIVDFVIPDGNKNLLNLLSIVMIAILIISLFIKYIKTIFMVKTGLKIDTRLILGYYKHLLKLPQSFFDNMRSGEIISRINDAVKIRTFINETLVSLTVNIFTVILAFGLMFTYYWKLAIIMIVVLPLFAIVYALYNRANKIVQRKVMENAADLQAQLIESINTAGTIKRFNLEEYAHIKTETQFVKFIRSAFKSSTNSIWTSIGTESISRVFTIILLWTGTGFVLENVITSGELMSFYALMGYFIGPVASLVNINRSYQDAKIAASRLFEIMDLDVEEYENKIEMSVDQCGDILFNNVKFRYGTRTEVFNDLTLRFPKGKVCAIVGESGSGKTTIASLILNLYPIESGSISIGNVDVNHIKNSDLRSIISIVPQKIDLFEGTILENIALDSFKPDMKKVIDICRDMDFLTFIESLPMGFNTNVGENGVQLSGGQRQRIAIARALYKEPQILILDEATSALDSESEQSIKMIVENLRKQGKTVIIIAHRLGTVMNSDNIIVLKNGKMTEQGTHNELIDLKGDYYNYWKSQTQF